MESLGHDPFIDPRRRRPATPQATGERQLVRNRRRLHARQAADVFEQLPQERIRALRRVAGFGQLHGEGGQPLELEAGIDGHEVVKAACQQGGGAQQPKRQSNLHDDETAPQSQRLGRPRLPRRACIKERVHRRNKLQNRPDLTSLRYGGVLC